MNEFNDLNGGITVPITIGIDCFLFPIFSVSDLGGQVPTLRRHLDPQGAQGFGSQSRWFVSRVSSNEMRCAFGICVFVCFVFLQK